jgi:hypothetical protein
LQTIAASNRQGEHVGMCRPFSCPLMVPGGGGGRGDYNREAEGRKVAALTNTNTQRYLIHGRQFEKVDKAFPGTPEDLVTYSLNSESEIKTFAITELVGCLQMKRLRSLSIKNASSAGGASGGGRGGKDDIVTYWTGKASQALILKSNSYKIFSRPRALTFENGYQAHQLCSQRGGGGKSARKDVRPDSDAAHTPQHTPQHYKPLKIAPSANFPKGRFECPYCGKMWDQNSGGAQCHIRACHQKKYSNKTVKKVTTTFSPHHISPNHIITSHHRPITSSHHLSRTTSTATCMGSGA